MYSPRTHMILYFFVHTLSISIWKRIPFSPILLYRFMIWTWSSVLVIRCLYCGELWVFVHVCVCISGSPIRGFCQHVVISLLFVYKLESNVVLRCLSLLLVFVIFYFCTLIKFNLNKMEKTRPNYKSIFLENIQYKFDLFSTGSVGAPNV